MSGKKKLLFVINSLGIGGAEKSLSSLLNALDFEKYDADLLMFNPGGAFIKLLPKQVHILPQLRFLKLNSSIKKQIIHPKYLAARLLASAGLRWNKRRKVLHPAQCYWKYAGWAFDNIEKEYDAAIAWGQGNPTHYVAEKVHALKKIAFVNADYEAVGHNKDFDRPIYEKYHYIVCVSDILSHIMRNVYPDMSNKITTIYDINSAEVIRAMAEKYNPFTEDTAELIIVSVGRLIEPKGFDLAISAAGNLDQSKKNFRWYIVGEGPQRSELQQSITAAGLEERVILTGAKENPYVYINHCDIYVQTSRVEGYCLTIGEARILNKPIVSTNFEVVYNQIRDGENGLIAEMNGSSIADAILKISKNENLQSYIINNLKREKKGNVEEIKKFYAIL